MKKSIKFFVLAACAAMFVCCHIFRIGDEDECHGRAMIVPDDYPLLKIAVRRTVCPEDTIIIRELNDSDLIPVTGKNLFIKGNGEITGAEGRVQLSLDRSTCTFENIRFAQSTAVMNVYAERSAIKVKNSEMGNLNVEEGSDLSVEHSSVWYMDVRDSRAKVTDCHIDSGGLSIVSHRARFTMARCTFALNASFSCGASNSLLIFRDNHIYSRTESEALNLSESFCLFEDNTFEHRHNGTEDWRHDGKGVYLYHDSYALVRRNIIKGFSEGVTMAYDNQAVVYNNTFINNDAGVAVFGMVNLAIIGNNIFANPARQRYTTAMDFSVSSYEEGKSNTYHTGYNQDFMSIDSTASNFARVEDIFKDTLTYELAEGSPLMHAGLNPMRAFAYTWDGLDTSFSIPAQIQIETGDGLEPNIGAK